MSKSPEMKKVLDHMSNEIFGNVRSVSIEDQVCVWCGEPANKFRDPISRKEFGISGFCQVCQDNTFGTEEGAGNEDV